MQMMINTGVAVM